MVDKVTVEGPEEDPVTEGVDVAMEVSSVSCVVEIVVAQGLEEDAATDGEDFNKEVVLTTVSVS